MRTFESFPVTEEGQFWGGTEPLRLMRARTSAVYPGPSIVEYDEWYPDEMMVIGYVLPIQAKYLYYRAYLRKDGPLASACPGDVWRVKDHLFFVLPWENNPIWSEEGYVLVGYDDTETTNLLNWASTDRLEEFVRIQQGPPPAVPSRVWDRLNGVDV